MRTVIRTLVTAAWSLLISFLCPAVGIADPTTPEISVENVAKVWEARAKRTQTFRFQWDERYSYQGKAYDNAFSVTGDGEKIGHAAKYMSLNLQEELVRQEMEWVWSPEKYINFLPPGAVHYPRGFLRKPLPTQEYPPGNDPNLLPVLMNFRPFHPAIDSFSEFKKRFHVVRGTQLKEGRQCIMLQADAIAPTLIRTVLHLDPERDFVLVNVAWFKDGHNLGQLAFHEYQRANEIWAPMRWTSDYHSCKGVCAASEFTINAPSDPKHFELEFPPGTWVNDADNREYYIVKEGGKRRMTTSDEMSNGAIYDDYLKTEERILFAFRHDDVAVRVIAAPSTAEPDPDEDTAADLSATRPIKVTLDDASYNQMLFGKDRDEASARAESGKALRERIADIDRICALTDPQKQKLELSGRGDTERLIQNAVQLKSKIKEALDQAPARKAERQRTIAKWCDEARPLRRAFDSDSIDAGPLFAKAVKSTLTAEQAAKIRRRRCIAPSDETDESSKSVGPLRISPVGGGVLEQGARSSRRVCRALWRRRTSV